jgi:hypothetical protein
MVEIGADFQRDAIAEMAAEGLGDPKELYRDWWIEQVRDIVADLRPSWIDQDVAVAIQAENESLRYKLEQMQAVLAQRDAEMKQIKDDDERLHYDFCKLAARAEAAEVPPLCKCGRSSYRTYCVCGERLAYAEPLHRIGHVRQV